MGYRNMLGCSLFDSSHQDDLAFTLPCKQAVSPLKIGLGHPIGKLVFQPSIFRCENVSFTEGIGSGISISLHLRLLLARGVDPTDFV